MTLDADGRVVIPKGAANSAALLRLGLGLLYLWGLISQGFGVVYSNTATSSAGKPPSYGWHFAYNAHLGWITSGFKHSPTAQFVSASHGPLAFIAKDLPTGVVDGAWMFALAGLGIALTLGIFMRIAGWAGFLLNIIIWFSGFPPKGNPVIDGEHMAFAFGLLLLMFLHAGNRFGLGRWWEEHTPAVLH